MKTVRRALCALAVAAAGTAAGAVFQYAAPVAVEKGDAQALLWIPHEARQVRGVVLAGKTLIETEFVKDPRIRAVCAEERLAILYLTCGLQAADLQKVLDGFAAESGYRELTVAPLFFVGHSAGGPQAQACATRMAARCFGLLQYRGGMPSKDAPIPPGIPSLAMMAQFDEFWGTMRNAEGAESWERAREYILGFRALDARNLGAFVVEPGAGHFAWSERNAVLAAMFLRKAARARIPETWPADAAQPPGLATIDPATGWLADLSLAPDAETAAFADYKGDRARTSWYFDREMAEATVAYHQGLRGRKDQFLKWEDAYWVDAGTRFFFHALQWVDDGRTFEVHPAYADVYPAQVNNQGPKWPQAGQPVGHSSAPIRLKVVAGPLAAAGANRLRFVYDALSPATGQQRPTFMAFSEGDAEYRYAELVGMANRGFKGLDGGKAQTISFPQPADLGAGGPPVALEATSDSGLPVDYYVAHGPAVVEDGKLRPAEIPARAKFPIAVKIVACQFGCGVEPKVKTAAPVERTVQVGAP